jgi:hypothetical protein
MLNYLFLTMDMSVGSSKISRMYYFAGMEGLHCFISLLPFLCSISVFSLFDCFIQDVFHMVC